MPDYKKSADIARRRGLIYLEGVFRQLHEDSKVPAFNPAVVPHWDRPRLCLLFNNKDWCDGRLSIELAKYLTEYDSRLCDRTDRHFVNYNDDIYIYRSAGRVSLALPKDWCHNHVLCIAQSERGLDDANFVERYKLAGLVVAQNKLIRQRCIDLGMDNVSPTIIANGINLAEFNPAQDFPEEFTVGASGNFSIPAFDDWKGFSKYIVPACRLAGVKLKWCGWRGQLSSAHGAIGEQIPLDKMGDWYRSLSCLISMSVSEGCSGVVFEAMATGLPVISTKVGWHGDVCTDELIWAHRPTHETKMSVTATIESIAIQLTELKENHAKCKAIGSKARLFAEQWPHSRIADEWRPILAELLERSRNG